MAKFIFFPFNICALVFHGSAGWSSWLARVGPCRETADQRLLAKNKLRGGALMVK